jgi:hypothetical protein
VSGAWCAACGLPGHRYGRNEGMERFDRQACINMLRSEIDRLQEAIRKHKVAVVEATEAFAADNFTKLDPTDADRDLWALLNQKDDRGDDT